MRRARLGLALALGVAVPASAEPPPPEGRAFVEVRASKAEVFVGEPFSLTLRVGFDAEWFGAHAVPLFQEALDVPVHVEAPGLLAPPGTRPWPKVEVAPGARRARIALDDGPVTAAEEALPEARGDSPLFHVVAVERRLVADVPGRIALAAPALRFAYADRFRDDLVRGRVPLETHDVRVEGTAIEVVVRPLPAEGRPPDFTDAVGDFALHAETDATRVEADRVFRLRLRMSGGGNLPFFEMPRPVLPGFHVYGVRDDRGTPVRTVTYDLAATEARVSGIPAIALPFFDPARGYRVARSDALPLEVAGRPEGPRATTTLDRSPRFPWAVLVGALVGLATLVAILAWRRRAAHGRG